GVRIGAPGHQVFKLSSRAPRYRPGVPLPLTHGDALAPDSDALLAQLAAPLAEAELYLAGSAALALYLGHRTVRDLDFMAMANRLTPPDRPCASTTTPTRSPRRPPSTAGSKSPPPSTSV